MALSKADGNMYEFVTHCHTHLAGECPHKCSYCYVRAMAKHYPGMKAKYSGPIRIEKKELDVRYGSGKTIFIEHCNDLFAENVPGFLIAFVLSHCAKWPDNTYVFQTKNPARFAKWREHIGKQGPFDYIIGCTIETNRARPRVSDAPTPYARFRAMEKIDARKFITIEPVLDFDSPKLAGWISAIRPEWVNIGADSKGHGLPEPSIEKVMDLVGRLKLAGVEVREKRNLDRLRK